MTYDCEGNIPSFQYEWRPRTKTIRELYENAVRLAAKGDFHSIPSDKEYDPYHLDCLLHPQKHPLVIRARKCRCSQQEQEECARNCSFGAIEPSEDGSIRINPNLCLGCKDCLAACKAENLVQNSDTYSAFKTCRV